jgi:hypothetical protein
MHAAFSRTTYVLKRKGLAIAGKYQLLDSESGEPLLFVEDKTQWLPPKRFGHVYSDESKTHEVLTLVTSEVDGVDMDVIDAESGAKIGGFGRLAEPTLDFVFDEWAITDASDQPIGRLAEKGAARSAARHFMSNDVAQALDLTVGETLVGELRQKVKPLAYELVADFSADGARTLDRRMGVAAAIFVAMHQGSEPQ